MGKQFQYNQAEANRLEWDGAKPLFLEFSVQTNTLKYEKGQMVKLTAAGVVGFCTAGSMPIGYVTVANDPDDPNGDVEAINKVTVRVIGGDVSYGYANLAIPTIGTPLEALGSHVGDVTFTDYKPALTGTYASAVNLETALITAKVRVLHLYTPIAIP